MGSYFDGGSPSNYGVGGARFWFSRLLDESTSPVRYEGYRDFGNIIEAPTEAEIEELEHFSIRTGTRVRDRALIRTVTEDIVLTLDEFSIKTVRDYFMALTISTVAAGVASLSIVDEIAFAKVGETTILGKGYNASGIVVQDITAVNTFTTPDDYDIVDIIGGYKGLLWKAGSVGPNLNVLGEFVRIDYDADERAHKTFNPSTTFSIEGKAVMFGVSDTGNEFIREFERVQLLREGAFGFNAEDWSSFQLRMKVLDDSEANPTMPAGIFRHYGVGTNI